MNTSKIICWVCKIGIAVIFLQTLPFKFGAAQESIDLFTKLAGEKEALMRIGTGVVEAIAVLLLFLPKQTWLGAGLAAGTMAGAIASHIGILGINGLFWMAVAAFVMALVLLVQNTDQIPFLKKA